MIGPSRIVTVFSALDGADSLELVAGDQTRQPIATLGAWDRKRDWAYISTDTKSVAALPLATGTPPKVGDRCYSMESGLSGLRVLAECLVVGRTSGDAAELVVQFQSGRSVPGAPVLNEFGEVVGLVAGPPPASFRGMMVFRLGGDPGSRVVPVPSMPATTEQAASIADLKGRNVLISAVDGRDNILSGGFAANVQRNPLRAIDQRDQYSRADKRLFAFLTWDPRELLAESKPGNADFRPGNPTFVRWELPVPQAPGTYRVDVTVGDQTMWRGGFRVTP